MRPLSPARSLGRVVAAAGIAALLVGSGIGGGGRDEATTAAVTHTVGCVSYAWHPVDGTTTTTMSAGRIVVTSNAGDHLVTCGLSLPSGVVVTKVQFTLQDSTTTGQATDCGLFADPMKGTATTQNVELAAVPYTGIPAAPNRVRLTDSSIKNATIRADHAYWLQCRLGTADTGGETGVYGATVTYRG